MDYKSMEEVKLKRLEELWKGLMWMTEPKDLTDKQCKFLKEYSEFRKTREEYAVLSRKKD